MQSFREEGTLFCRMDYFFCSAMCPGAGWKRDNFGNPLLCKKVLRARRTCITQNRSVSRAPRLTMHVGATPSGPEPSGNPAFCAGLIFSPLTGNLPICRVRAPQSAISPPCAATGWEFSERGSRGNPAKRGVAKGFSPWQSSF